jgi:hypothetical protein
MGRKNPCTRSGENVQGQSWCCLPNENHTGRESRRLAFGLRQASAEHTRLACCSRRLAANSPPLSGIQSVAFILSIGEGANRGTRGRVRSPEIACANPVIVTGFRPMNSSGRSQTRARVLIASVLFAAFSWTLLVSASPQLHGYIHDDANRSDHVCAVTLIASGSYEHAAQPAPISGPQFDVRFATSAELTSTWVKPLFLNAHIFAHAPPAHS